MGEPRFKDIKQRIVRDLYRNPTLAEKRLRTALVQRHVRHKFQKPFTLRPVVGGKKYDSQPLRFYVADFYLPESGVIIELDGSVHDGREYKDTKRSLDMIQNAKMVKHVLRFTNKDVIFNIDRIIGLILSLRPVRLVKLDTQQKQENKRINAEIARRNEIECMVKADQDIYWNTKKQLIRAL